MPEDLGLTLGDLLADGATGEEANRPPAWIPPDVQETITGRRLERQVWEPSALSVGTDLHPHMRQLLGASHGQDDVRYARAFRLTDSARKLLGGKLLSTPRDAPAEARRPKRLVIQLGPRSRERLSGRLGTDAATQFQLHIEDARYLFFRTGQALLVVEVAFSRADGGRLHPYWVVEGLGRLARFNELAWDPSGTDEAGRSTVFSLGSVVRQLSGDPSKSRRERRVYTVSFLHIADAPEIDELRHLAVQLSRHYTDAYRIARTYDGVEFVSDFEEVLHAFSLEGCATLVGTGHGADREPSEFLANFKTNAFERHYLPLTLVSLHEFNTLLQLSNDASFWPELDHCERDIARLEALRDQILRFRLCYRFSHVSFISMHNAVNQALRRTLELDRMSDELKADTEEIERYLEETAARRTERRFLWVSVIGGAGLAWLTTFTVIKELLESLHLVPHDLAGLIAVGGGLVAGGVAWWATLRRGRHPRHAQHSEGKGHLVEHALLENVIHRH